ncbi:MAG: beta-ketoacyl synthase N-terminal-like domain-containing protein, partial [Cyclobacteriaceae bacterium]
MKKRENTQLQQPKNVREPIAIIGMGCRFPGEINDPGAFWDFLKSGGDAISEVPADRWNIESFYDPNPSKAGKIKSYKGGFLKDIDKFDAGFFGIFPNEAQRIDPQQRHLLEVAYEAFQDAGITLDTLSGSKTGVYMGVFMNDYWDIQASTQQRDQISPHVPMGVSLTAIANRLSYVYNLKGPSMTLDTACSSSLVCVHLACQGIWNNETELALAGGVNLIIRPESSIMMSKGNFLSPDGYCKSFDSRANGYVRSEGSGVIVLKPLSKALEDGDQIYALIRGSAVNQDGHTEEGFTVPSYTAQVDMLKTAYEAAGVSPSEVSYVEAHGTGTPVGDPIETRAFGEVIGKERQIENACVIGSVKSNIGHLEAAAGIAGIIKLALVLKNRQIPSNLHFLNPNPNIPFDEYKLRVPTKLENIDKKEAIFGGVNSFGAGGTNAHVVLEEYIPAEVVHAMPAETEDVETLILSAKSGDALKATASTYRQFLAETTASLKDICFSTLEKRTAFEYKLAVCGKSKEEIMNALDAFVIDETRPNMTSAKSERNSRTKIGFVFSGQGPQWYAMGQQLIKTSPVFRDTILQIEGHFKEIADWSLLEEMNKDEQSSRVSDTRIAQPAIMAIQVALTALWKSWGIVPQGCVGHSIGEVAAAYASGALTLEQAVEVIFHRSRGQNKATDKGKMLAVGLPLTAARAEILGLEEKISIAAINGPNMVALSGDADALEIVAERLNSRDIFHRYLKVNVPFHSHHMDELKEDLISSLIHLKPKKAEIPLYSTVTGKQESGEHLLSEYWFQNVREPVYFTDAIQSMIDDGFDTFIEVAPHPILSTGVNEMFEVNKIGNGLIIPSLRRGDNEAITMRQSLGMLWVNGYELSAKDLFANGAQFVKLPKYPWQSQSYWFETREHKENRLGKAGHPFLLSNKKSAANNAVDLWDVNLNPAIHLFLEDHKVDGAIVFPGTGHLEMAQAVGNEIAPEHFSHLEDVQFEAALFLPEEGESPEIRLEIGSDEGDYSICSRSRDSESEAWSYHSKGRISTMPTSFISKKVNLQSVRDRATEAVSIPDFYLELKEGGLNYGESFRCVQKIWTNESEVLGTIKLPNTLEAESQRFLFHPA